MSEAEDTPPPTPGLPDGLHIVSIQDGVTDYGGPITQDEVITLSRSRGDSVDPTGFKIDRVEIKKEEFFKKIKGLMCAEFPLPFRTWRKVFGPIKTPKWVYPRIKTRVFYDQDKAFVEEIGEKSSIYYGFETLDIVPSQQELLEYNLSHDAYIRFLEDNDMALVKEDSQQLMSPTKLMDNWGNKDKGDIFSNIDEDQRTHFGIARWVAARTWDGSIFGRINSYLRLGHSVGGKLLDKQADTLIKTHRVEDEADKSTWDKIKG